MSVDRMPVPGGAPAAGADAWPGRTIVADRVLKKVAQEVSANTVGVGRGDVAVDVAEYRGGLALRLATPLPIPDLNDTAAVNAATPIVERTRMLQQDLRDEIGRLLGRDIMRISIDVTGAVLPVRRRVR